MKLQLMNIWIHVLAIWKKNKILFTNTIISLHVASLLYYTPPEQYSSKVSLGPWTDIYSLGAVMYEAITQNRVIEAIEQIEGTTLVTPMQINPRISSSLNTGIMKALNLKINERFQTADEFYRYLKDMQFQEELALINRKQFAGIERSVVFNKHFDLVNEEDKIIAKKVKKTISMIVLTFFLIIFCIVILFLINT